MYIYFLVLNGRAKTKRGAENMRFSRLVQLYQTCDTLNEAATYIQEHPLDNVCGELMENGTIMLQSLLEVIEQHRVDLKNNRPIKLLNEIQQLWSTPLAPTVQHHLTKLQMAIQEDINYQIRAVFFAELGAKWDSLESVYWYMKNDPRFDPVVVLTPIYRSFEINGETKSEIIYEDYLTELGIPFYNYTEYSLEEDLPELAFTSQPYESVTLPAFWAEYIAKYTRLVYLPYFISDILPNEPAESSCSMNIHMYAWKICAFSEKFFNYVRKRMINNAENYVLTGLPKLDPIVHVYNYGWEVPKEWEDKLNRRKVFLWNTWYSYPLSSLPWMEKIILWFMQHEEYALIWRPHPMTDIVTNLWNAEYMAKVRTAYQLVEKTNNIVIDRNPLCNAAFFCSDAMISDPSSLATQYLLMDKPTMILLPCGNRYAAPDTQYMIDNRWHEIGITERDAISFIERIGQGEDKCGALRKEIRMKDLPLADGKAGERLCELLWNDLHKELLK